MALILPELPPSGCLHLTVVLQPAGVNLGRSFSRNLPQISPFHVVMALADPAPQPQTEGRVQPLVLRLDPLHNWSDLLVLGFAIFFTTYMAIGEVLVRGWSAPGVYNHLSIFAPVAFGLSTMAWRRFRRVRLIVDEEHVEAISVWGKSKRCRLEDLIEVAEEGKPLARQLLFVQKDGIAFKVFRNVWTKLQLRTLAVFLGVPVAGANEPLRSRLTVWIAAVFTLGMDALFVVMAGAVLADALTADLQARSYKRAVSECSAAAPTEEGCYALVPVKVEAVGDRSFNEYPMTLNLYGQMYVTSGVGNQATHDEFRVGMTTGAKWWKGKLTLVRATDANWIETTDNPLYKEQSARTGPAIWIVALVGLIPILTRLHPVIT
jgi:hypothetical protein